MSAAAFIAPAASVAVTTRAFFAGVRERLAAGAHLLTFYGQPGPEAWGDAKPKFAYEDVVRTV